MSDNEGQENKNFVPKEKTVIIVIHVDDQHWQCKEVKKGQREMYFLDAVRPGCISGGIMLLGQFLFEFERLPEDALRLIPGATNRLYLNDGRKFEYDYPTEEELNEFKRRMNLLKKQYDDPKRDELIDQILAYLN